MTSHPILKHPLGLALLAFALSGHAAISNGGFESGNLGGWTASGVTAVIGASNGGGGPKEGSFQAYLDTSPDDATVAPHMSSISQAFAGGGLVSFWWNFATNEPAGSSFNDTAYVILDGTSIKLADTFSPLIPSTLGGYADMTGYHFMQLALGSAGSHTISFVIADGGDGGVDSALLIDAVTQAVPEPMSLATMGLGLAVIGVAQRRRRLPQ